MRMNEIKRHTRGRGSNPASKANLRKPKNQWFVYSRGSGIGWTKEMGPMTQKRADLVVKGLERFNSTGAALYCSSME